MVSLKRKSDFFSRFLNLIMYFAGILLVIGLIFVYDMYRKHFIANVNLSSRKPGHIYIPTGSKVTDVFSILYKDSLIINHKTFEWLAAKKHLAEHLHPGHYIIRKGMNNEDMLRMLIAGRQEPIKLTFNNIRTRDQLAEKISTQIEASESDLKFTINDDFFLSTLGYNRENIMCIFLPNTYEFYWNTSAEQFILRMTKEFNKFWTAEKKQKAEKIGLSPVEVIILASIVDEETDKTNEEPRIAGVYVNRINKHMLLQADPTVRYALGDFTISRILKKQLEIESPYNTYIHSGLPPGPISIPSIAAINSVLNYEKHSYLYFCASEDFTGYHHFSKTLEQHLIYAQQYQKVLNKHRIMK
jgi:UPF0755 protein